MTLTEVFKMTVCFVSCYVHLELIVDILSCIKFLENIKELNIDIEPTRNVLMLMFKLYHRPL